MLLRPHSVPRLPSIAKETGNETTYIYKVYTVHLLHYLAKFHINTCMDILPVVIVILYFLSSTTQRLYCTICTVAGSMSIMLMSKLCTA